MLFSTFVSRDFFHISIPSFENNRSRSVGFWSQLISIDTVLTLTIPHTKNEIALLDLTGHEYKHSIKYYKSICIYKSLMAKGAQIVLKSVLYICYYFTIRMEST